MENTQEILRERNDTLKCQNEIFRTRVRQMNQEIGAMKVTIKSLENRIKVEQESRQALAQRAGLNK